VTVLVLNQNWEVLAVARVPRALALIDRGKAEILETGVLPVITSSCSFDRPAVIRLINFVKRPRPRVRFGRQNVFTRDLYTCQYCGSRPQDLTIDHVVPISRGGQDTWENVVAGCRSCNHRKGARTPDEARMQLRRKPVEPRLASYPHVLGIEARREWLPFLTSA
jgi:5-methylcytosine-specific restriction endonuclease McrA